MVDLFEADQVCPSLMQSNEHVRFPSIVLKEFLPVQACLVVKRIVMGSVFLSMVEGSGAHLVSLFVENTFEADQALPLSKRHDVVQICLCVKSEAGPVLLSTM